MDANERFEYMANLFYQETRILAPGKDYPSGFYNEDDNKKRVEAWRDWTEEFYSDLFFKHKINNK